MLLSELIMKLVIDIAIVGLVLCGIFVTQISDVMHMCVMQIFQFRFNSFYTLL